MKILIIRHGEPNYAKNTLTPNGFKESEYLGERLKKIKIDDIYSSPYNRAVYTARPTADAKKKEIIILDWLKEFQGNCVDDVTGEKVIPWNLKPQIWTKKEEYYNVNSWMNEKWMDSATVREQYNFVTEKFDELLNQYGYKRDSVIYRCEQNADKTIALFCHFALGMVLISHLCAISPVLLWQTMFLPTSSVTTFVTEEREKGEVVFKCKQMGDTSHLYANNTEVSNSGLYPEFYGGEGQGAIV